jgi:hypothetical protein
MFQVITLKTRLVDIYVEMGMGFEHPPIRRLPMGIVKVRSVHTKGKMEETRYVRVLEIGRDHLRE